MRIIEFLNNFNGGVLIYLVFVKKFIIFIFFFNLLLVKNFFLYLVRLDNLGFYIKGVKGCYFLIMFKFWKDFFWSNIKDFYIFVVF